MRNILQIDPYVEALSLLNRALIATGVLLLMLLAGVQLARAGAITVPASAPSTTAYHFSSHPMISGTVVTVNDHQMVVNTDQGEQVTLEIDSRTLAPRDLAPGMVMRAEFLALEDCRFYAQRIMPIRGAVSTDRLQAYANTRNSPGAGAYNASLGRRWENTSRLSRAETQQSTPTVGNPSHVTTMTATPASADYGFSTRPMVSGTVVSVNDHYLLVVTDQGRRVGLVMDSHTMVPREVAPGTVMRAEFTPMKDGRYYAKRISRIGTSVVGREQAYAQTRDRDLMIAASPADCGFPSAASGSTAAAAVERREVVVPAAVVAQAPPAPVAEAPATLPQTASSQPLNALLGVLALAAGGALAIRRRFWAA